jgi:hypothetical protein
MPQCFHFLVAFQIGSCTIFPGFYCFCLQSNWDFRCVQAHLVFVLFSFGIFGLFCFVNLVVLFFS